MRDKRLINVLLKNGKPKRITRDMAAKMIKAGEARRYISNTVYRALALGIKVKDPSTRDSNGKLKRKIIEARKKEKKETSKD